MTSTTDLPPARRILVIEEDSAVNDLLAAWLEDVGHAVVRENAADIGAADAAAASAPGEPVDLVVLDIPDPRRHGVDWVRRVAQRHPMTPLLALSCSLLAGVDCSGTVARRLGVGAVLPKPVSRERLLAQVDALLAR